MTLVLACWLDAGYDGSEAGVALDAAGGNEASALVALYAQAVGDAASNAPEAEQGTHTPPCCTVLCRAAMTCAVLCHAYSPSYCGLVPGSSLGRHASWPHGTAGPEMWVTEPCMRVLCCAACAVLCR